jgi:hypothetical protein
MLLVLLEQNVQVFRCSAPRLKDVEKIGYFKGVQHPKNWV